MLDRALALNLSAVAKREAAKGNGELSKLLYMVADEIRTALAAAQAAEAELTIDEVVDYSKGFAEGVKAAAQHVSNHRIRHPDDIVAGIRALSPPASAETEKELPGGRPPWTTALPTPLPGAGGRNPGSNNERIIARIKGVPAQPSDPVIDPREPNMRPGWDTPSAPAGAPGEEDVARVIWESSPGEIDANMSRIIATRVMALLQDGGKK